MRKPLIAGNWKLHKTINEAKDLAKTLCTKLADVHNTDIVLAPSFTAISAVAEICQESTIKVGGQNCFPEPQGAFTGEVSAAQLNDAGCTYVILGHSERRQLFGEDDAFINAKIHAVLRAGMSAILCVGETLEQREQGDLFEVLGAQVRNGLKDVNDTQMEHVVIAYEPIWAIGTGKTASSDDAAEVHAYIRGLLQGVFSPAVAQNTRIIYGGSVKPDNISELMAQADIDGALVGGASLNAADFAAIANFPRPLHMADTHR
ncbi:MAG: triose-phosphate isomerase [Desulfuromonadaceae bacterium]|nr:triose-phosphate isomerase [Desulfuromonas sp.]MDY0184458.1 triose-phosphate isomerase [Desulfuromonadaceae bacterium]